MSKVLGFCIDFEICRLKEQHRGYIKRINWSHPKLRDPHIKKKKKEKHQTCQIDFAIKFHTYLKPIHVGFVALNKKFG